MQRNPLKINLHVWFYLIVFLTLLCNTCETGHIESSVLLYLSASCLLYYCLKLFSVLLDWVAKISGNQTVMKGQDLNLSLCTESEVIALKTTDFIHCFTFDGGLSC